MKAADIPDDVFVGAVEQAARLRGFNPASRWDVAAVLAGHPEDVGGDPQDYPEAPWKVVVAKARKLIRRGRLDGCACGCRGDFSIPCDHPGIEHGPWSYTGICPRCQRCRFIGHGPLCFDCYAS